MDSAADLKAPASATHRSVDDEKDFANTKGETLQATEPNGNSDSERSDDRPEARTWRTSFLYFGPLSGIVAMLLAAASVVACLGVLAGSDGQSVDGWKTPPSTYIAIFTAIANMSMRYAAIQGVFIAWWRSASKGSTLARLETSWRSGFMLRGAITAGRRMGLLGFACICSTIVVVDGPLIQRASGVIPVPSSAMVPLNVTMTPEIPHSATGGWVTTTQAGRAKYNGLVFNETIITANGTAPNLVQGILGLSSFYHATDQWRYNSPLGGVIRGCPGRCLAKLEAPAMFPVDCKTGSLPVDFHIIYPNTSSVAEQSTPPLESDSFATATRLVANGQESISVFAAFGDIQDNGTGTLHYRTCIFRSGIGSYDISIENDQIVMESLQNPRFVAFANNTAVDNSMSKTVGGHPSTLAGISSSMKTEMDSLVSFYRDSSFSGTLEPFLDGLLSQQFAIPSPYFNSYSDPFDFLVNRMNRLMVYLGGAIASSNDAAYYNTYYMDPGLSPHTVINGAVQGMVSVYHTTYYWFLGAALIELSCIAVVALTYWGWWRMGRPVSLSPLEIAKAFRSPLLAEYNSNSTGRELAAEAGEVSLKYGVLVDDKSDGQTQLAFGDPALVSQPVKGMRFDK
ncbi:hypothetical protein BDY17DRAFT_142652 [Neohortaea acidophila]|uniref:Uncharacterized protein n=1 Tax=Neohortaea acidophila TaxID=245834 RepID=A0A6A6PV81_9PEZI|nr:uncharacterized protein BDY17DRAFT_142652 [Neohortaea acidophila]KAF2483167.1 hypothetical protein BDY17DRAFT_142652 [Neohortaea acidophila]